MAQFEIKLNIDNNDDVSFADGHQVEYSETDDFDVIIRIMSTKVVNYHATATINTAALETNPVTSGTALGGDDFTIIAYNEFGGTVALGDGPGLVPVVLGAVAAAETPDGLHFRAGLNGVTASSGITRVLFILKKDSVELADPRAELDDDGNRKAEGKNAEASIEIHFVDTDNGAPTVFSMWRADDLALPVTAETVDIIILLSEKPKAFTKDHVDVTNRDVGRSCGFRTDTSR